MLFLLQMTTTTFNRCILALIIHFFVAILAQFMGSLLIAVHFGNTYVYGMAVGAFINHHDLILGMMTNSA